RVCPKCGSAFYRKANEGGDIVRDRICLECETHYAPVPTIWLVPFCLMGSATLAFIAGYSVYDRFHGNNLPWRFKWPAIFAFFVLAGFLILVSIQIIRWNLRDDASSGSSE